VVTDVDGAGGRPRPGITGQLVADAVVAADPTRAVVYIPDRADLLAFLTEELGAGDLCLTLGAGDITLLPDEILARIGQP